MPSTWSQGEATTRSGHCQEFDIEKNMYDNTQNSLVLPPLAHVGQEMPANTQIPVSPISPIHEGITPFSSVARLSLQWPAGWQAAKATIPDQPAKKPARLKQKISRWIVFQLWFNTYRKFFTIVTLLNLAGIIMAALGRFPYAENHLGALVLGNLLCAILMRNELFLRFLYMIAIYGLRSWAPLRIRLAVTSILQHVGGIHSGCALSGAGWLIFKIVEIIRLRAVQHKAVIVTGVITNTLVIISVLSAFPWVRNYHHNVFEKHHRFIGWLGLAEYHLVLRGPGKHVRYHTWGMESRRQFAAPRTGAMVCSVYDNIPSPKVAILRFERGMQQGLLGRISRTSIMEYHAFGIISEGRKSAHHYMICGVQGDFTKGLVTHPPKTVWTRELKFAGVGYASAMFKRGIRICTGTGIGAALSTCIQSPNWFLIWIGSDQERTFGPTITGLIRKHIEPERMILWDSNKQGGRPDTMELLKATWTSFGAEVIFITSNMQGNDEMMQGCRAAGLHAFGTLWDF
ncbi:hypothetical protein V502_05418 [Pseudogymnoascus sp. VKM F-4520 (FW-2644)]|nr:hypothetical protein V502_05418 [Pseudogymnoascus sp. VKM F-4520 (FW-2644)]